MALVRNAMVDQQAVQRIVIAATKMIHTAQISQQLLKMMKAAQDPAAALAQTTVFVMKTLMEQSKGFPQTAIVPAGKEVIGLLAEMAQAAGLFKADQQVIKKAMLIIAQGLKKAAQNRQQPQQAQQPAPKQAAQPQPAPQGIVGQAMGA